jgi:hypothetical protein
MMRGRWDLMLVVLLVTVGGCATVQQSQPAQTANTGQAHSDPENCSGLPGILLPSPMSGPIRNRWATGRTHSHCG